MAMHATEELVFTGSTDCTARVWGIETGSCAHVLRGHDAPISSISLQPAGDHLLLSSLDGVRYSHSDSPLASLTHLLTFLTFF